MEGELGQWSGKKDKVRELLASGAAVHSGGTRS